jgi:molybdenum cofactor cytidylyltransferase
VSNPARSGGLSTSVRRGLRAAQYASASLLVPIDLARLDRREMARLINRWRGARRRVVAREIDGRPGAPLILPHRLFARALDVEGDVGLKGLVRGLPIDELILMDVPSAAFDVDTPRDLERARRQRRTTTDY